ncbi:unnamed protein product [Caenorhabditis angaria]|uniref:Uncharacterized protein n=1 Tax=Caenorhabditis angaria TaxID=860376 RepID=A0A9P1J2G5_9PELO|nr:unnamed protein product [Caenorhabditis angaria]
MADEEQQMEVERLEVEGLQLEIGQLTEQVAQLQAGIQQRDAEIQQLMVKNEAERIHEHQKIGEKRRWREERSHQ